MLMQAFWRGVTVLSLATTLAVVTVTIMLVPVHEDLRFRSKIEQWTESRDYSVRAIRCVGWGDSGCPWGSATYQVELVGGEVAEFRFAGGHLSQRWIDN